jgi:hypothetical protein
MSEIERSLVEREAAQERARAISAFLGASFLYSLTGSWPVSGGAPLQYPPAELPPGLTERQLAIVVERLRKGRYIPRNPFTPIDHRLAARLQGRR